MEYQLPQASQVKLVIYDINDQIVRELTQGNLSVGYHHVIWDRWNSAGKKVATGIYIYLIVTKSKGTAKKGFMDVKKMVLMK